jgi:ribonuclease BN (tRNA processing enzyme)
VLLGTKGGPRVGGGGKNLANLTRMNPANLLIIDGVADVIDCGYGVSIQMVRAGAALQDLRYIFITHHHSDHELEYGNLIYNGWATGLNHVVDTFGPPGLEKMTRDFMALNQIDIETRIKDEGKPDLRNLVRAHDIRDMDHVLSNGRVQVSAMYTLHPPLQDSYAFKFEFGGKTVVFSGDTTYNPKLAEFAQGADYLVHEVIYLPGVDAMVKRVPNAATLREHLLASHTTTEDVGRGCSRSASEKSIAEPFRTGRRPLHHRFDVGRRRAKKLQGQHCGGQGHDVHRPLTCSCPQGAQAAQQSNLPLAVFEPIRSRSMERLEIHAHNQTLIPGYWRNF